MRLCETVAYLPQRREFVVRKFYEIKLTCGTKDKLCVIFRLSDELVTERDTPKYEIKEYVSEMIDKRIAEEVNKKYNTHQYEAIMLRDDSMWQTDPACTHNSETDKFVYF